MGMIAIIPARGGSKRLPRKNIKDFMGKPMITYAIQAAKQANIFDEIMVSTDDAEIASIAKQCGANVPFIRSEKNSSDFATTADVLLEVFEKYKEQGQEFESLCCIYPCVPFLTNKILQEAYSQFAGVESLMPVCKFAVPIEWAMKIEDKLLIPNDREAQNIRSQDLVPKFYDVGMFYFITTEALYRTQSLLGEACKPYIIDEIYCQDIDTIADWKMAEMKYRIIHGK